MALPLINKGFKPVSQIAVVLGTWGGGFIAAAFASLAIMFFAGISLTDSAAIMQPENATAMKTLQAVSTLFIFGIPAVMFAFICYQNGWVALGFGKPWIWKLAALSVAMIIAAGPLTDALSELNKAIPISPTWKAYFDGMEKTYETQVKAMLDIKSIGGLMVSIVLIAGLPALFEELFFRGALQGVFIRWVRSPWLAIGITAIVFSAIHLSWYGFLPRVMLGIVLGAVYYATGNLWYSILMHFVNNAAAVIYLYVLQQQGKPLDMSTGTGLPWWAGIISVVIILFLIKILFQQSPPETVKEVEAYSQNPFVNDNSLIENESMRSN
jgi:membrane protease YdiL (CAAX protease family)